MARIVLEILAFRRGTPRRGLDDPHLGPAPRTRCGTGCVIVLDKHCVHTRQETWHNVVVALFERRERVATTLNIQVLDGGGRDTVTGDELAQARLDHLVDLPLDAADAAPSLDVHGPGTVVGDVRRGRVRRDLRLAVVHEDDPRLLHRERGEDDEGEDDERGCEVPQPPPAPPVLLDVVGMRGGRCRARDRRSGRQVIRRRLGRGVVARVRIGRRVVSVRRHHALLLPAHQDGGRHRGRVSVDDVGHSHVDRNRVGDFLHPDLFDRGGGGDDLRLDLGGRVGGRGVGGLELLDDSLGESIFGARDSARPTDELLDDSLDDSILTAAHC